jgi:dihydropteroate synthase
MHMQGTPQTMQDKPQYQDVVGEILEYLAKRKSQLEAAGIATDRICLDPGIGFGKTHDHNVELIRKSYRFLELNSPILVGHSRKGFIGKLSAGRALSPSVAASADRDAGTLAITLLLAQQGIHIIRVHDVARTFQAVQVDRAIRQNSAGSQ